MIRTFGLAAGAMLLAGITAASAQDVVIAPDQQVVIREYVIAHPVEPAQVIDGVHVGQQLPPEVTLYPLDSPDMSYSYVVMNDHTLIVDPPTREIVQILD